jgi:hypothetical protein
MKIRAVLESSASAEPCDDGYVTTAGRLAASNVDDGLRSRAIE